MNKEHLIIFDTTLRDGEQSPGASMDIEEKIQIANALSDLNVDVIEAGFPIASNGDYSAVKEIADSISNSRVCALARALEGYPKSSRCIKECQILKNTHFHCNFANTYGNETKNVSRRSYQECR